MSEPITQAQDHDRRIGRLEAIAEQLNYRLDTLERSVAELSRRIDALNSRMYWLLGIQVATLISMGSLLFSILSKLPG